MRAQYQCVTIPQKAAGRFPNFECRGSSRARRSPYSCLGLPKYEVDFTVCGAAGCNTAARVGARGQVQIPAHSPRNRKEYDHELLVSVYTSPSRLACPEWGTAAGT